MTTTTAAKSASNANPLQIVGYYTLAASATGAVPVPAASVAIVVENTVMVSHISDHYGVPLDISTIISSFGTMGMINIIGRNLFVEGARLLSWGTGSFWAGPALVALGAATAGIQTYILGLLAIKIAENGGNALSSSEAQSVIKNAKDTYDSFIKKLKREKNEGKSE